MAHWTWINGDEGGERGGYRFETSRMTKKNTINIQQKIPSVLKVTRPGEKKGSRGATKKKERTSTESVVDSIHGDTANEGITVQTWVEVRTLSFCCVEDVCAYRDHRGHTQGVVNIRRREALEAVHELDLICIVEREDWSVRIPILLARLCTKEVTRARVVNALVQAIKFGHLDGDWRNHGNIKVLIEHRRTPINPQVRCVGPGIRLVLERDWLYVGNRERSRCLPGINGDMHRLKCRRRIRGHMR